MRSRRNDHVMLSELTISNFAIIENLRLSLASGFNVLTGETGAGKSIIIDAVSTLLGGRADSETIRTGAEGALIEGIYVLSPALKERLTPLLQEYGLESDEDLIILTREINRSGRNVCRVNGRAVALSTLRQISQQLVDIHGQGENQSLRQVRQHVLILDRYAGLTPQRAEFAEAVRILQQTRAELAAGQRDERELARRIDLLEYQIAEIEAAHLRPGEEEELRRERTRLANAERLITLSTQAHDALSGGEQRASALDLCNEAVRNLISLERLDPEIAETRQMVEESTALLEEASRNLRNYRDSVEYNPARLEQVEERLDLIHNLTRKYGASIEEVLQFQEEAKRELESISHHEERIAELQERETALLHRIGELGERLSAARRGAASRLEREIEAELEELRMSQARFVVSFQRTEAKDGAFVGSKRYAFDQTGLDRIEFLVSPNIGEEPKPVASIASGGETSRLMLAMKSVLSAVDETPTLIFDEIDTGIGGRVGAVVGHKLWKLAQHHQVLCVTHLPQMAAFGDAHYRVAKRVERERTITVVEALDKAERTRELAAMLGGPESEVTLRNAEAMLEETLKLKQPR